MPRPPNYEFQDWWNKQRENGHDVVPEKYESTTNSNNINNNHHHPNSPFLTVEIRNPSSDPAVDKEMRARSVRQLSGIYLLKLQQIAHSVVYAVIYVVRTIQSRSASDSPHSRFYRAIKWMLILVISLLCFELAAYFKGWHFSPPTAETAELMVEFVYATWLQVRADYLAPPLKSLGHTCIVLFLIQSLDRLVMVIGCAWIKFRKVKPTAVMTYPVGEANDEDAEDYPMVLVQIPMCNEREVSRCRFQILGMRVNWNKLV